jgi:hypothetical protein
MWAIVLVSPSAPLPASISGWVGELICVLIGFWWLMLFIGKVADEEFTGSESAAVPAAILAVSWLLILELPWLPLAWMLKTPIFLYGRYIGAPYSHVISTTLSVLSFVVGVALLKRSKLAFWLAVSLQVFYFTSSVVTDFTPSAIAEINRAIASLTKKSLSAEAWQCADSGVLSHNPFGLPVSTSKSIEEFWGRY